MLPICSSHSLRLDILCGYGCLQAPPRRASEGLRLKAAKVAKPTESTEAASNPDNAPAINQRLTNGTSGGTSLAAVAPGISEALVATAAGLLAAIPALMAYNHFRNSARKLANDMRDFSMELANRIEWIVHGQLTVARE